MDYKEWTDELIRLAITKFGFREDETNTLRDSAWRDFYDEGYSPEEALFEDLSNG